jgi:6-phosphofructokinase 1
MELAIRKRNEVDPNGDLWMAVLESTGQPPSMTSTPVPVSAAG